MTSFKHALKRQNDLFIPFITAGDPSEEATIGLAKVLQDEGADILELGIPYSDPLADGPVIQEGSARALAGGMTLTKAMKLVSKMRASGVEIPVVIFTYYNPVLQLGEERFFALARENQVDGVLVPDLPFEESHDFKKACRANDLALISLVAPTSKKRVELVAKEADGFLYCVSSLGVTGERASFSEEIGQFLTDAKTHSSVPVAVGFGVSTKEQATAFLELCDGVVIGSAIVRKIGELQSLFENSETLSEGLEEFRRFITSIVPVKSNV
ncbi:tryptophan synthase subunit alpha [Aureibacillus halotolerans]|uniref:Tryptophan synthase alpha chain n=1 Tax=Aureibacillus halotolerans TaxID=1508390 RepID=A0A4R6U770_9BACI|nr:tryptophan synthase subunit alpha [Aureibacillus halotolerans]TDQ41522.1 tryptophan synthase alpha chain [Aureibacillus halotolerans]